MTSTSLGTRVVLVSSAVLSLLVLFAGTWIERQLTDAMRAEEVRQAKLHAGTLLGSLQTLMLNGQGARGRGGRGRGRGGAGGGGGGGGRRGGGGAGAGRAAGRAGDD